MVFLHPDHYNGFNKEFENEYDYLEIGTCDWDTFSMTKPHLKGIIVEPIDIYINNIPDNINVIKQKCAISTENKVDFMYYIPPKVIESTGIVNCFRGMNKLSDYHMGHVSNNLKDIVVKQETKVFTYKTLLNSLNIKYIDFLKIDTEGHDCEIINNILDTIELLPRYIYFENNGLTDIQIRTDTIYRLQKYGYVHIFTEDDNTYMYNCKTYFDKFKLYNNIILPKIENINNTQINYFQNVHSYIEFGQYDLFKRILKLNTLDIKEQSINDSNIPDVIWTTHSKDEYNFYKKYNPKKLVSIVHGGYMAENIDFNNNIIVKSVFEWNNLKNKLNCGFFIGKYEIFSQVFDKIYTYRHSEQNYKEIYSKNNFLLLNGFFKYNNDSIKNTYNILKNNYDVDLYGYDSELGWVNTTTDDLDINVLTKYKFNLHLKGLGYLCNSVVFCIMAGIPVIMSRENYYKTQYYQFIPEELIIFYDNYDSNQTNEHQIIPVLENVMKMSIDEYEILCKKIYIHGNYFRNYYEDEIKHLYYFIDNLNEN